MPPAQQWSASRCALFDVNKPAPVAAVQKKSDNNRMITGSRKPGIFIKTVHHENNNDNKNDDNNNNKT